MILHLVTDEKIVNHIVSMFETALPSQNLFVCFADKNKLKWVKECPQMLFYYGESGECTMDFSSIKHVLIHYLSPNKIDFCNRFVPKEIPLYWILWGGDLYSLLETKGYNMYYKSPHNAFRFGAKRLMASMGIWANEEKKKLVFMKERLNYFCCSCKNEFELLQLYFPRHTSHLRHRDFFYYPYDKILGERLVESQAQGNVILVGNSPSYSNNHEYVFEFLSKLSLGNYKVVTPLNYGGKQAYIDEVVAKGQKLFGAKYEPLMDFLPLDQYNKFMATAEICVYGNFRQEAVGNIVMALYLGSKIFMTEKSILFPWLKQLGFAIYGLEQICQSELIPLSNKEREINRELVKDLFSENKNKNLIVSNWGDAKY